MRARAKAVNFGIIYGQSPFGLAKAIGVSVDEAARFIDAYYARHPGVEAFVEEILEGAARDGYVTTMLNRRRDVSGVRPHAKGNLNQAERIAVNTVVQGSAADMIKLAMIRLERLRAEGRIASKLLLQIHDELLFETPRSAVADDREVIEGEMSGALTLDVPVEVKVSVGENWLDVH
jgi:DNA polymerase-1